MKTIISRIIAVATDTLKRIINFFEVGHATEKPNKCQAEMLNQVTEAQQEWKNALNNFNYPMEWDMIDYAIYNLNAAEKKYTYLIKKAREEHTTMDVPSDFAKTEFVQNKSHRTNAAGR